MVTEIIVKPNDALASVYARAAMKKTTVKDGQATYEILDYKVRPDFSVKYKRQKVFG